MKTITNLDTVNELNNITLYDFNVSKTNEDDNVWFIEPQQEMITFSIKPQSSETIQFEIPKGYTWEQFVNSEYNTPQNYYTERDFTTTLEITYNDWTETYYVVYHIWESDTTTASIGTSDGSSVNITDEILENVEYVSYWPPL